MGFCIQHFSFKKKKEKERLGNVLFVFSGHVFPGREFSMVLFHFCVSCK